MESILGFVSLWGLTSLTLLASRLIAWKTRLQVFLRYFLKVLGAFISRHQQAFWIIAALLCCSAMFNNNFLKAGVALEAVFLSAFLTSFLLSLALSGLLKRCIKHSWALLFLQEERAWGTLHLLLLGGLWLGIQPLLAAPGVKLYALLSFLLGVVLAYLSFQMYLAYLRNEVLALPKTAEKPDESIALGAVLAAFVLGNTFSSDKEAWAAFPLYLFLWLSALRTAACLPVFQLPQKSTKASLFLQAFLLLGSLLLIAQYAEGLPAESLDEEAHFSAAQLKVFLQAMALLAFLLHLSKDLLKGKTLLVYIQGLLLFAAFMISFVLFGLYGLSLSILLIFVVATDGYKKKAVLLDSSR